MAQIQIDGVGVVEVDDSFLDLSPEEQQQVVDQIKAESQQGSATPNQAPVGGSGDISARPEAQPTPGQQKQIDGLVKRGVPEEEARASVMGQEEIYQSEKELFDPSEIPEIDEVERLWNDLTPEQQAEMKSIGGGAASATISFLDNVLPFKGASFALGIFLTPDQVNQVKLTMKANPEATNSAAFWGTIVGLVGGPAALAKGFRGVAKLLRSTATKRSGHISAAALKEFRRKSDELIRKMKSHMQKSSVKDANELGLKAMIDSLERGKAQINDLLEDWGRHIYEQKWTTDEIRNFLENRLNDLPPGHVLNRIIGGKADLFDTFWAKQPQSFEAPSGFKERIWTKLRHRAEEISKNVIPEATELVSALGGDAAANYWYSYNDWKDQGFSSGEAHWLALSYTIDKTPRDLAIEVMDQFFGAGTATIIIQTSARLLSLAFDVSGETGQVRPDVYKDNPVEDEVTVAGQQYQTTDAGADNYVVQYNRGGPVMDPMRAKFYNRGGLSDKVSKIHGEGYTAPGQAYAIAKNMGYNRGGQAMREKYYRMSGKPLPKLIR